MSAQPEPYELTAIPCRWCAAEITEVRGKWVHEHNGKRGCVSLLGANKMARPTRAVEDARMGQHMRAKGRGRS